MARTIHTSLGIRRSNCIGRGPPRSKSGDDDVEPASAGSAGGKRGSELREPDGFTRTLTFCAEPRSSGSRSNADDDGDRTELGSSFSMSRDGGIGAAE